MNHRPDPDETRQIRRPPTPPGSGPQIPWWQNVNRQVPPLPPPPQPQSRRPPAPARSQPGRPHPALPPLPPAVPPPPKAQPNPRQSPAPSNQAPKPRSRRRTLIRVGIAVLAVEAVALGVVLYRMQSADAKVLDVASAQRGVEQVLMDPLDGYGARSVSGLVCNDGANPPVRKGSAFSCDAVVDGAPRRIAVVFQDDDGTYAVDRPR